MFNSHKRAWQVRVLGRTGVADEALNTCRGDVGDRGRKWAWHQEREEAVPARETPHGLLLLPKPKLLSEKLMLLSETLRCGDAMKEKEKDEEERNRNRNGERSKSH